MLRTGTQKRFCSISVVAATGYAYGLFIFLQTGGRPFVCDQHAFTAPVRRIFRPRAPIPNQLHLQLNDFSTSASNPSWFWRHGRVNASSLMIGGNTERAFVIGTPTDVTHSRWPERRPVLLAISPVPPWPVKDGMSLRVSRVLKELASQWSIVLISPAGGESAAANGVGLLAEITFPKVSQWMYVPSQYDTAPVVETVQRALRSHQPAAALLWGGMEYLRREIPEMPPFISDRVDSMTLSSWRMLVASSGWREFRLRLAHLAYVVKYEFTNRRASRAMVVVGDADANVLRRFLRVPNVHVIPNGVDVSDPRPAARSPHPTVMFTGVLSYRPNIDAVRYFVDEIWPAVHDQMPSAVFQIVGSTPTAEINSFAAHPGVEILANVRSVPDLLAQAWLAVAPMRTGCGIKNKILEAWSVATPAVMTPMATNGLNHAPCELLLTAEGSALSSLIVEILGDPERRRKLGALARTTAIDKFSWREAGKSISALLADALGPSTARREA